MRCCKSARESATYCTQCIHIYLKRDGVSLDTKRTKLEEVNEHQTALVRRNKLFGTFMPGSAQLLEGRTAIGIIGLFAFLFFVCFAVLRTTAPVLAPASRELSSAFSLILAVLVWCVLTIPVFEESGHRLAMALEGPYATQSGRIFQ